MGSIDGFLQVKDLNNIIKTSGVTTFVETGCHIGHSLKTAIHLGFTKLYSCDIDIKYVELCRSMFSKYEEVTIEHMNSVNFLHKILPELDNHESVLFFLDAHLPDLDVSKEVSLPLEEELKLIWQHRSNKKDHIIIDDLRIYEDNVYSGGNWVDRSSYGNPTLDFLNKYSYNVEKFLLHEGYIYLTNNIVV